MIAANMLLLRQLRRYAIRMLWRLPLAICFHHDTLLF